MIYPKFLSKGNTIGVPAPSSGAYDEPHINKYKSAKAKLENMGYNVVLSENYNNDKHGRSSDAKERAKEINDMFSNKDIDFITCLSGGEFLVEILPYIDFEIIKNNPKFIQGFSDPTGLLIPITAKLDIATIYGSNIGSYGVDNYIRSNTENLEIISGNLVEQKSYDKYENERITSVTGTEGYNLDSDVEWKVLNNNKCHIKGRVLAGCFDLISELAGTKYDGIKEYSEKYKEDGIVFVFDNCDYSKEEVLRTLWRMNELEYFKNCNGIVFGRFGRDIESYVGYESVEEMLKDTVVNKLNIPIIFDADISHKGPNMTIINGSIIDIEVEDGKAKVNMSLK